MQREQRLRSGRDFAAVYRRGRVQSNHLLVVRVAANGRDTSRVGFVTGRTVGGAVVRNRVKRRLREAARALSIAPGFDIVVGARRTAAASDFAALSASLRSLLERAGVVARPPVGDPS